MSVVVVDIRLKDKQYNKRAGGYMYTVNGDRMVVPFKNTTVRFTDEMAVYDSFDLDEIEEIRVDGNVVEI